MTCNVCNDTKVIHTIIHGGGTDFCLVTDGRISKIDACYVCAERAEVDYQMRDMYQTGIIPENVIKFRSAK